MLSTDTAPTRLGRAKLIAQDLLNLLKGDRVGLIAFAGTAFLQAPLTLDKGAVLSSIQDLDTNTIPKGGTDIAAAIRMAIAAFGKGEGGSKALVLMTDGEELDESGVEAAKEAAALGIRIFTIGFGSPGGSLIPIKTESGENDFVRDENGNPVNSKLDAPRLTEMANATGGFYQPFGQDTAKIIYDQGIVPIAAQEMGTLTARKPIERYAWPATAALILLCFWSVLGEGRSARIGRVVAAGLIMIPLSLHASGISDYNQGNYQGALKDFEHRIESGTSSPAVRFDAGAAAYKAGDFKKAAGYFSEAMTASDSKIRDAATYNLANSLVRTGEAAKEDDAKLSDWKNSLQHYETVLKETPGNTQAKENRDIVKKLIEDLKKQQDQKKNDQKKDDQKKDQKDKNKDQSKNDQSKENGKSDQQKDQDQKDQQKNDQSQNGSKDSKDSGGKDQKPQAQKGNDGQASPTPSPSSSASPDQGKGSDSQKQDQQPKDQQGEQKQDASQQPTQPKDSEKDQQNGQAAQPTPTPGSSPQDKKEGKLSGGEQGSKPEQQQAAEAAAAGDESKNGEMTTNQANALLRSVQDEEQHVLNQQQRAVDQTLRDW
jgi:Ca-activated chloride channel family protein